MSRFFCINEMILPVAPQSFSVTNEHNTQNFETLEVGELIVIGKRKAETISLSSFFPSRYYPFAFGSTNPFYYINAILGLKNENKPVRFMVTNSNINKMYVIRNFTFESEPNGDIKYTLEFVESKDKNTPTHNNENSINSTTGLRERP